MAIIKNMVMGKNSRGEGRKSSRNCSTVSSVAVFVAFCFAGIWIVMLSIVQMQNLLNSVIQLSNPINEGKHIVSESGSEQFEDNLRDLLKESTRGGSQTHKSQSASHPENQNDQKGIENVSDDTAESNQQEVGTDSFGEKHDLEKGSENTIEENYQIRQVKPNTEEKESGRNLNSEFVETETLDDQINNDELRGLVEALYEKKSDKSLNDYMLLINRITLVDLLFWSEDSLLQRHLINNSYWTG